MSKNVNKNMSKKKIGFFTEDDDYILNRIVKKMVVFSDKIKHQLFGTLVSFLYKHKIGPNILTLIGLFFAILANILIYFDVLLFVLFVLIYFLFDLLDGTSAKLNKCQTAWGNAFDDGIDLVIALLTTLNVGFFSGYLLLASLSMMCLFFQEWLYGLLYRIDIKKIPIHSYIPTYFLMFFGAYAIAFYANIVLSAIGIIIGAFFFLKAKNNVKMVE